MEFGPYKEVLNVGKDAEELMARNRDVVVPP